MFSSVIDPEARGQSMKCLLLASLSISRGRGGVVAFDYIFALLEHAESPVLHKSNQGACNVQSGNYHPKPSSSQPTCQNIPSGGTSWLDTSCSGRLCN